MLKKNTEIHLHNTLTGIKEVFTPLKSGTVKMYHCGPTVYNYAHLGNLRSYILADTLRRMFEYNGYTVQQVINITDVGHLTSDADDGDDKMENMATKSGKSVHEIAEQYTAAFFSDLKNLHIETEQTQFPKASEHIKDQIALIQELETKGFTYTISDGVYFDTSKFSKYGKLGNIYLEGLREGARLETSAEKKAEKRNLTDFALWKFSPENSTRSQEWQSPWGVGFPGWHIECSAMSMKYLGKTFDIHTGGIDHIPVHHNNEIAQSESATGQKFAHYWLHNAFVNVPSGKMAKSADNFLRLENLAEEGISYLGYRYWLLTARYSTPVQFSIEAVKASDTAYKNLIRQLAGLDNEINDSVTDNSSVPLSPKAETYMKAIGTFICDDLDTPKVIAIFHTILTDTKLSAGDKASLIYTADTVLGLNLKNSATKYSKESALNQKNIPEEISKLLADRESARESKDWVTADKIRDILESYGYTVKDSGAEQILSKK